MPDCILFRVENETRYIIIIFIALALFFEDSMLLSLESHATRAHPCLGKLPVQPVWASPALHWILSSPKATVDIPHPRLILLIVNLPDMLVICRSF